MKIIWGMLEPLEEYKKLASKFNEQIQALTNGEVEVEVILFDKDPENPLKEIENGDLDIYQVPTTQLAGLLPEHSWLKAWEVPFLFKNETHVEQYIASEHSKSNLKSIETDAILPLTYSYAGGFCAVVSKRGKTFRGYEDINFIEFSKHEYEDMDHHQFLVDIYQHLPSNILMYEVNEMLKLKPENKTMLNIDVTKHVVIARISMISKSMLAKLPAEHKDVFLSTLNRLLDEERQTIYDRSAKNVEALKTDGCIGYNKSLNQEIVIVNSLS